MKTKRQTKRPLRRMRLERCQPGLTKPTRRPLRRTRQANCQLRRMKSQPDLRCCSLEREAELGSEKRRCSAQMWP